MIFFNPGFESSALFKAPSRTPLAFHRKLPEYTPTPLHALPQLARNLGFEKVWVKDESSRLGLPAFKILGASWATYSVFRHRIPSLRDDWRNVEELAGQLREHDIPTLYSATDGNHGRAVARVARLFGGRAAIYVPNGTAQARIAAIRGEGASVTVVSGTYDETVATAARDAADAGGLLIQDNGWKGYEEIPRFVIEGYSTMLHEIDDVLKEEQPTHVVVQIGVGSLAEAVVRHYRTANSPTIIIGVEPESAACAMESVKAGEIVKVPGPHTSIMAGMNCDSPSLVSFPVMQKGIRCFVTISDERAMEAMRLLAESGIESGETGAAGMGALLEMFSDENRESQERLALNERSRILVISTEGATDPDLYKRIVA